MVAFLRIPLLFIEPGNNDIIMLAVFEEIWQQRTQWNFKPVSAESR
jgi:hypothetical protein